MARTKGPWLVEETVQKYKNAWFELSEDKVVRPDAHSGTFATVGMKPGDREWTCEITLPIEDIVTAPHRPPLPGDRWRMNLFRGEQLPVPAGLAWSPTLRDDFHVPQRFGELVFR